MSCQHVFLALGVVFEFVGVVLVGFPDLHPHAIRVSGWLRRRTRPAVNRVRRLFRRPPVRHTVNLASSISAKASMRASAVVGATPEATLEEKVDFLLRRDQEAQRDMNTLTQRVEDIEAGTPRRLEELRGQMEGHVEEEVTAALEEYRPLRIVGTISLALGVVCVSVAAFA